MAFDFWRVVKDPNCRDLLAQLDHERASAAVKGFLRHVIYRIVHPFQVKLFTI